MTVEVDLAKKVSDGQSSGGSRPNGWVALEMDHCVI